jgi:hypothetical protein
MTLHPVLEDTDAAVELVARYYSGEAKYGLPRSGSHFDHWGGGGDRQEIRNELTSDDFLAVSFLYVNVPPEAAIALLGEQKHDVDALLREIPHDKHLSDLSKQEFEEYMGPESSAQQLWDLLTRKHLYKWDIGATIASKILARKRPKLIPITDKLVGDLVGRQGDYWLQWYTALTDGSNLKGRLNTIKKEAGIEQDPTPLRVLDVILWMHASDLEWAKRKKATEARVQRRVTSRIDAVESDEVPTSRALLAHRKGADQ